MIEYSKVVFVFGSNTLGRHGKGAALHAVKVWGAQYGIGYGIQGNAYAIPTKDDYLGRRSLKQIDQSVERFYEYTQMQKQWLFLLTPIGCGLAGYKREQIRLILSKYNWGSNVTLTMSWFDEDEHERTDRIHR